MASTEIKIALAGNPNSGKTTLFNALTGSNQFVGNWPGVTVEKKEGKLKKHDGVTVTDLPGIYSLSPYTLEEVVARNYLVEESPDVILNIVDGTNLERNLYLTTQLTELGIPVVMAVNMIDVVNKNGDKINLDALSEQMGCKAVSISALKGTGIMEAAEEAIKAAKSTKTLPPHTFSGPVEHALAHHEHVAYIIVAEQKIEIEIGLEIRAEKLSGRIVELVLVAVYGIYCLVLIYGVYIFVEDIVFEHIVLIGESHPFAFGHLDSDIGISRNASVFLKSCRHDPGVRIGKRPYEPGGLYIFSASVYKAELPVLI
jgi:small GTP-binding protein